MYHLLFTQWYTLWCVLVSDNWKKLLPGNPGTREVMKKYYRLPGYLKFEYFGHTSHQLEQSKKLFAGST
jgi:hypothetical protein